MFAEIKNHLLALFWIVLAVLLGFLFYNIKITFEPSFIFIAYLGLILALIVFSIVDYFHKPNFVIHIGEINEHPNGNYRFVHVNVFNLDWPNWFFFFRRSIAENTTAEILFKGQNSPNPLFSMKGRWSINSEPIKSKGRDLIYDPDKARTGGLINLSTSMNTKDLREGKLGIAIKLEGDNFCYGFSDESYSHNFKNPAWRLARGVYDIEVTVRSGRNSKKESFVLENLGNILSAFTLKKREK